MKDSIVYGVKPQPPTTSGLSSEAPQIIQKYDADKAPLELVDDEWIQDVANVLDFGTKKYARNAWRKGMEWSRVISAAKRHLAAINRGEDTDPETGLPHSAHLSCCAMFLNWYLAHRPEFDDRYKENK